MRPCVVGLVLCVLWLGIPGRAQSALANTVEVSAEGRFETAPDTALVNLEVTGQNPDLKVAYSRAQAQAGQVRDLLRRQGFTPQQAHWSGYSVQPNVDYKTRRVTDYTVTTSLRLEFTDFAKIGPLLDAAGAAGLDALRNVSFELKDLEAARAGAIANGYRQVRQEAEALAHAAGRDLLGLSHASVDVASPSAPRPLFAARAMVAEAAPPPTAEFTPGLVTVTAQVNATYLLKP